jgi:hypothetical protein
MSVCGPAGLFAGVRKGKRKRKGAIRTSDPAARDAQQATNKARQSKANHQKRRSKNVKEGSPVVVDPEDPCPSALHLLISPGRSVQDVGIHPYCGSL